MPTIERNKELWDGSYHCSEMGDEWSKSWGGTYIHAMAWYDFTTYSCLSPSENDFRDCSRLWEVDAISKGLIQQLNNSRLI